ncbi:MAG: peroxiredoxin [Candidatus Eisenbacteria bacterium]
MRELREFRERHDDFRDDGILVAGVSSDTLASHQQWTERLHIPYPLVSDTARVAAHALGLVMTLGIGGWNIELFRRTTLLVGRDGRVAAVWGKVKVRGHARTVLEAARALGPRD